MHLVFRTNTHHDVTDLVNHGMVQNTKSWISLERNTTFLWNKKIINLSLRLHFFRSYRFVAEVTFKDDKHGVFLSTEHYRDILYFIEGDYTNAKVGHQIYRVTILYIWWSVTSLKASFLTLRVCGRWQNYTSKNSETSSREPVFSAVYQILWLLDAWNFGPFLDPFKPITMV